MAGFFNNICSFNCGKIFPTLSDLILHIESNHIDFDPETVKKLEEEKPEALPMSYVLRFRGPEPAPPHFVWKIKTEPVEESENERVQQRRVVEVNNNYLNSAIKKKEKPKPKKLPEASQVLGPAKLFTLDYSDEKPFGCNMDGCLKRYKNFNGVKYHYRNYHKMYVPALSRSILKQKVVPSTSKKAIARLKFQGFPLYKQPTVNNECSVLYHLEGCESKPNEFFYKSNTLPTSDVLMSQVPLANNTSFNYCTQAGDNIENISGKNSNFFLPNHDRNDSCDFYQSGG